MLPASEHVKIANICLDRDAHFVSSSYVSEEMKDLHEAAVAKGLTFINEVGLDPGLDHLLAHDLIESFKESEYATGDYQHSFRSYCGGFPSVPNDFKYKFSWSPVGVLRALKSPASWMQDGAVQHTGSPWKALKEYAAPIASGESFQAYPNRDSIPFINQYHFPESWKVTEFVRGTLRLDGWADAWSNIFDTIDNLKPEDAESVLKEKSDELWENYSYQPGEADRVVLCVEHEVKDGDQTVWHKSYSLDEIGNEKGSAMARLVSLTVSLAIQSILAKELPAGVLPAVSDRKLVRSWIDKLRAMGETINLTDHLG
jgi:saccharopine dehydrogenase-like NADP-dependent oxidoreductase